VCVAHMQQGSNKHSQQQKTSKMWWNGGGQGRNINKLMRKQTGRSGEANWTFLHCVYVYTWALHNLYRQGTGEWGGLQKTWDTYEDHKCCIEYAHHPGHCTIQMFPRSRMNGSVCGCKHSGCNIRHGTFATVILDIHRSCCNLALALRGQGRA
jgi:hypothetical protein